MSNLYPRSRVLWSLAPSGLGTTISGAGNSGGWQGDTPGDDVPQVDFETAVDLRDIQDVALLVTVGGITSAPAFQVQLDVLDDAGNLYAQVLKTASLSAPGSAAPVYAGLHGGAASSYLVLPSWARVSWTCAGGTVTGVASIFLSRIATASVESSYTRTRRDASRKAASQARAGQTSPNRKDRDWTRPAPVRIRSAPPARWAVDIDTLVRRSSLCACWRCCACSAGELRACRFSRRLSRVSRLM